MSIYFSFPNILLVDGDFGKRARRGTDTSSEMHLSAAAVNPSTASQRPPSGGSLLRNPRPVKGILRLCRDLRRTAGNGKAWRYGIGVVRDGGREQWVSALLRCG